MESCWEESIYHNPFLLEQIERDILRIKNLIDRELFLKSICPTFMNSQNWRSN